MGTLPRLPADRFDPPEDLVGAFDDADLVYFCCNVGDADAQLLLLPKRPPHDHRRAIVVDAGITGKIEALIVALVRAGLLPGTIPDNDNDEEVTLADEAIALVVATHPHDDHIRGMPRLLERFGSSVVEFWDSGYWHPIRAFHETMEQIERHPHIIYAQPTSGLRRWIHDTQITVLAPAVHLKSRYDSYGIEINDASVTLRVDYPASRVVHRNGDREIIDRTQSASLVLGADAQHDSWAHVVTDFPKLHAAGNAAAKAIRAANGVDHLKADVLKVAHHSSKRGLNLELIERIAPKLTVVSCGDDSPRYNFPHRVAQDQLREAIEPTGGTGAPRAPDWDLNIFYTADTDTDGATLGTIAARVAPGRRDVWRLGDARGGAVRLNNARRWTAT